MAIRGLSMAESENFILPNDPGHPDNIKDEASAEEPTVWQIGNLTADDRIEIGDLSGGLEQSPDGTQRMVVRGTEKAYMCVTRGLVGFTNFLDTDGNKIPFKMGTDMVRGKPRKVVSAETMGTISKEIVLQLANAIMDRNGMRSDLEKKFGTQLQQLSENPSEGGDAETAPTETNKPEDVKETPT